MYKTSQSAVGKMNEDIIEGPSITWNSDNVIRMVEKYGRKEAIRIIAGEYFKVEYVTRMVDEMMVEKTA